MANNELSGPIVSMSLISYFKNLNNYYSMRFLFLYQKQLDQLLTYQKIWKN